MKNLLQMNLIFDCIRFLPRAAPLLGTEAMYLMMVRAFDLGYRRYEWKCDALNAPSRAAAQRLGFSFEGIFRQAVIVKGRNRDTAWYAAIDSEWPALTSRNNQCQSSTGMRPNMLFEIISKSVFGISRCPNRKA